MVDYKIGEWQLGKLKEAIQLAQERIDDTEKESDYGKLLEQCFLIIQAIKYSQSFEAPVVNIPSVWLESRVSHDEAYSRPEDYDGITAKATSISSFSTEES